MMTDSRVFGFLPAPKHQYKVHKEDYDEDEKEKVKQVKKQIPPYGHRKGFLPVDLEDFGDGGAYPEIHIVQYPLNMGKPGVKSSAVVSVDVDEKGQIRYDAIVKQGANKGKIVQTSLNDMKEKESDKEALALPDGKEVEDTAARTQKALEALLNGKISAAKPTTVAKNNNDAEPTFIRYTPNPNAPGYNPEAKQRVIRMVEAQVDPMEPPKHKHTKIPKGPPSPPAPVLHSPPKKLTVADQQAWKVPPCVSNWKNARGYVIPLDKRLAADGRGLQETTINNKFASFSESLYVAERKAMEDLRVRNKIRMKMAVQEKEDKEKDLRDMAAKARLERAGFAQPVGGLDDRINEAPDDEAPVSKYKGRESNEPPVRSTDSRARSNSPEDRGSGSGRGRAATLPAWMTNDKSAGLGEGSDERRSSNDKSRDRDRDRHNDRDTDRDRHSDRDRDRYSDRDRERSRRRDDSDDEDDRSRFDENESESDRKARANREKLRVERRKEREREMRIDNMKGTMRKKKIDRDAERDVSEKIALGQLKSAGKFSGEEMFDSRLFNQSAGLDSGFGGEDEYTTYSKPLFDRGAASSIYRPKRDDADVYGDADSQLAKLADTSRFKADKGFKGAEGVSGQAPREAPVQFTKHDDDEFGIDDIVGKKSKKARHD